MRSVEGEKRFWKTPVRLKVLVLPMLKDLVGEAVLGADEVADGDAGEEVGAEEVDAGLRRG